MQRSPKTKLLVALSEEFLDVKDKMTKYTNRILPKEWDAMKLRTYMEQLRSITSEFDRIRRTRD